MFNSFKGVFEMAKADGYEVITAKIVELLEQGVIPWEKPFFGTGMAQNFNTKKPYRGVNSFLLSTMANVFGWSNKWLTFNQIKNRGGKVVKGSKSTPVIFFKFIDVEDKDTGEEKRIALVKNYNVFNLSQTEGIDFDIEDPEPREFTPIEAAEQIVANMPNAPVTEWGKGKAAYSPSKDVVIMPSKGDFVGNEELYSTWFHELVHSTGHESRLDREELTTFCGFGSHSYSKEELTAEMGAAFLCGVAGIANKTIENSAAYIQSWLKVLKNDPKFVVSAASKAQKAADYIQGITY